MTAPARESTAVARVPSGACPWCGQSLTADDRLGAVRVGHAVLHATCADEYAAQEDVYAAAYPLLAGTGR